MRYPSPLRYPGGKGKLANFAKILFLHNDLVGGHYAEPYAGGASVALSLLFEEYAEHVHINDLSRPIFSFWHSVLNDTEPLCRLISDSEVTMEKWEEQKLVQTDSNASLLELGFSTFFLNRTNRSGIIGGGVIGGKKQAGEWTLDVRFNKKDLIDRIQKIARYGSRISVHNQDASEFLMTTCSDFARKSLIWLDPPYYVKGKNLYDNFYNDEDHVSISKLLLKVRQNWVVSYDNHPMIRHLYKRQNSISYKLSYSAQDRYRGGEVMFFSPSLEVPPVGSPLNIRRRAVIQFERDCKERTLF